MDWHYVKYSVYLIIGFQLITTFGVILANTDER